VAPVQILLAGMSNMLSSIVISLLADEPYASIAGHVSQDGDLASEIRQTDCDVLIVRTDRPEASEKFSDLVAAFPKLSVVAIDDGCASGFLHELRLCSVPLPEISATTLRDVLRVRSGGRQAQQGPLRQ
jgi:hypothetical protein